MNLKNNFIFGTGNIHITKTSRFDSWGAYLRNSRCAWTKGLIAVTAMALISATAVAQLPIMLVDDARVFEGNAGATLRLPVRFVGTQSLTVTGQVTAIPLSGAGFNPAT